MFKVVIIALCGGAVGYLLRRYRVLQHVNHTITVTIWFMLFVLGISVGENRQIVQHLWSFGGQGLLIGFSSILGSAVAGWVVYRFFFKRKEDLK